MIRFTGSLVWLLGGRVFHSCQQLKLCPPRRIHFNIQMGFSMLEEEVPIDLVRALNVPHVFLHPCSALLVVWDNDRPVISCGITGKTNNNNLIGYRLVADQNETLVGLRTTGTKLPLRKHWHRHLTRTMTLPPTSPCFAVV